MSPQNSEREICSEAISKFEIRFGTVYEPADYPNSRYVVVDLGRDCFFGASWVYQDSQGKTRLSIPGTHYTGRIGEIVGFMTLEEMLAAAKNSGWQSKEMEELFRTEAEKPSRFLTEEI